MAYADEETGNRRLIAIGIVAALHALAGFGIAKIGFNGTKQIIEDLTTFEVAEDKPPEPEKPPPPPEKVDLPPPPKVTVPPSPFPPPDNTNTMQPEPKQDVPPPPPPPPPPKEEAPPPPPPPKPKVAAQKATPKGNPGSWVTNDDYPPSAKRNEEAGTTGFRLEIGPDGRPTGCSVTSSSGSSTLDSAACSLLMRRAKFKPALDENGAAMSGSYSGRFTWKLEN